MRLYPSITVDLYKPYPLVILDVPQNNIGRGAMVTLTAGGAVAVPDGETVEVYALKPDGTKVYNSVIVADNQLQVAFSPQMTAVEGILQVELQMVDSLGNSITTPIFAVRILKSNIDAKSITSQDDFQALVDALAEVNDLKQNGLKGDPGEAATIQIGTVTASDPGGNPRVTNSGTEQAAVFDFVLPRGEQGTPGENGANGEDGEDGKDGSEWYQGTAITGTNASGSVFAGSGIEYANANDKYLNTGSGDDKGNVYNCVAAGNASTAQWAYVMNILGGGGASTAEEVTYDNSGSGLTGTTVQAAIDEIVEDVVEQGEKIDAAIADMADAYNPETTYAAGDYCIQNNTLYKCNTAIDTPEEWTEGHWDATTVAEELGSLNQKLQDSGWVPCTLGNSMSSVNIGDPPAVRRIGNVVYLSGVARTSNEWSTHASIITIPEGYRPDRKRATIQKGTGSYNYKLTINTNGVCAAENITNDAFGNTTTNNGEYFWFCDCWII